MSYLRRLLKQYSIRAVRYYFGSQTRFSSRDEIALLLSEDNFWRKKSEKNSKIKANMATLESLKFDNLVLKTLPIDEETENFVRTVKGACFSLVTPTPVDNPELVIYSKPAMELLDLNENEISRPDFVKYFSGKHILPGSETAAHCYCGHQFGYFSGQLGDGAAIYLGEILNSKGERWEIQLKGAGKTPYSRHADGRKVLRSSIREFLCSEAMHHLGIPTTRAGTCISSDTKVVRDIFYSGNPIQERCTVILRIAPTFIRFGSFEICKETDMETGRQGPSVGRHDILELMLQYVVKTFYPSIWEANIDNKEAAYLAFYKEIMTRTAYLVAEWQGVGFCHGVLNTDNMSIVGLTIDYGPYGFMDKFESGLICNSSDDGGRYTYEKQPEMCKWNCHKLAEALKPIVPLEKMEQILESYDDIFKDFYVAKMRKKFGLQNCAKEQITDITEAFLSTMEETGADFTNCFRCLSKIPLPSMPQFSRQLEEVTQHLLSQCCTLEELIETSKPRMDPRQLNTFIMLMQMNPDLLAQLGGGHRAITQELGRIEKTKELKELTQEDKSKKDQELWNQWLEKYVEMLKLEEKSSQNDVAKFNEERVKTMNATNPRIILRNYIAQNAIEKAEKGDYSEVRRVLDILEHPFDEDISVASVEQRVQHLNMAPAEEISTAFKDEEATNETAAAQSSATTSSQPEQLPLDDSSSCHLLKNYAGRPPSWAARIKVS